MTSAARGRWTASTARGGGCSVRLAAEARLGLSSRPARAAATPVSGGGGGCWLGLAHLRSKGTARRRDPAYGAGRGLGPGGGRRSGEVRRMALRRRSSIPRCGTPKRRRVSSKGRGRKRELTPMTLVGGGGTQRRGDGGERRRMKELVVAVFGGESSGVEG